MYPFLKFKHHQASLVLRWRSQAQTTAKMQHHKLIRQIDGAQRGNLKLHAHTGTRTRTSESLVKNRIGKIESRNCAETLLGDFIPGFCLNFQIEKTVIITLQRTEWEGLF